MSDLSAALREAGHDDIAAALERKALVRGLREAGRADLADALEAGASTPAPVEDTQPAQPHEQLAKALNDAQSRRHTLGGPNGEAA